jgi:hypothetical protein
VKQLLRCAMRRPKIVILSGPRLAGCRNGLFAVCREVLPAVIRLAAYAARAADCAADGYARAQR